MLSYAFHDLAHGEYDNISAEVFEHTDDLFSEMLIRGVSKLLKRGLYREYIGQLSNISTIRGKVDIVTTIHNRVSRRNLIGCEYDELTVDNIYNRIIKTTLLALLRSSDVSSARKGAIRSILPYFSEIGCVDACCVRWNQLSFRRNNMNYKFIINLCYLALHHMIPSDKPGEYYFQSLSERSLNRLFEKFVLNYYIVHHPDLRARAEHIVWDVNLFEKHEISFLPSMKSDITLSYHGKTIIIDTKFYGRITQQNFSKHTIHSGNLYQIYTYVKNKDTDHSGNVSGVLLYAKTDEEIVPGLDAYFGANRLLVETLDLNTYFDSIRSQLDSLVKSLYS